MRSANSEDEEAATADTLQALTGGKSAVWYQTGSQPLTESSAREEVHQRPAIPDVKSSVEETDDMNLDGEPVAVVVPPTDAEHQDQ